MRAATDAHGGGQRSVERTNPYSETPIWAELTQAAAPERYFAAWLGYQ